MKKITLKIKNVSLLEKIRNNLSDNRPLTVPQKKFLIRLCNELPKTKTLLDEKISFDDPMHINLLDMGALEVNLEKWRVLFENIPGTDFAPFCYIVTEQTVIGDALKALIKNEVLIVANFSPTAVYSFNKNEGYQVYLKTDGTAVFSLPSLEDAERYPQLYQFNGTWSEAYFLMIETIKKGWPMEEFPKELQRFLPK